MLNFGQGLFIKLATVTARLFLTQWRSCETHFTSEAKSYDEKTWSYIWEEEREREARWASVWCVSDADRQKSVKDSNQEEKLSDDFIKTEICNCLHFLINMWLLTKLHKVCLEYVNGDVGRWRFFLS